VPVLNVDAALLIAEGENKAYQWLFEPHAG
jgi:hypothetical protein